MKNPFKKKKEPAPHTPLEYVVGKEDLGISYEAAVARAKSLLTSDFEFFNAYSRSWPMTIAELGQSPQGKAADNKRIIYRLIPVAVVKSQPPTVEPVPTSP